MKLSWHRFAYYSLGIVILTLGIALAIQSRLGTSPFDAVLVGLFRTFGLTVGSWEIVLAFIFVLFNGIALRKRPEYLALLTSLLTGIFIDFWLFIIGDWALPSTIIAQSICLLFGMIFSGLGIAVNLQANFAPNPMDRTMLVVKELTGFNVSISRALIGVVLVIIALIFNGPIGVGTILIALFSGMIIKFFMSYVILFDSKTKKKSRSVS